MSVNTLDLGNETNLFMFFQVINTFAHLSTRFAIIRSDMVGTRMSVNAVNIKSETNLFIVLPVFGTFAPPSTRFADIGSDKPSMPTRAVNKDNMEKRKLTASVPNCGLCPHGHRRQTMLDHAFVQSKPSLKRHVHLQTVRWPSPKGDVS
jgi:hypothetical protein